jgi:DNA-binding NarL/FixJ family response regulator
MLLSRRAARGGGSRDHAIVRRSTVRWTYRMGDTAEPPREALVVFGGYHGFVSFVRQGCCLGAGGQSMGRILIADRHSIVRRGVQRLVEAQSGWEVCAEASDGHEALGLALEHRPDVAVTGVDLGGLDGIAVSEALKRKLPSTETVLLTMRDDEATVSAALAAGIRGYVLKSEPDEQLVAAIAAAAARRSFFSPAISDLLLNAAMSRSGQGLCTGFTGRELDVIQLVVDGVSSRQIAERLGVSRKTVESHRTAAMRKARVHTAGALVRFALRNNLAAA